MKVWTLLILIAGFALRLLKYPRIIYLDEAWVVNSIMDMSWHQMLFDPKWLPMPPPALYILLRWIIRALGPTEARSELLFFLISIAGMIVAAYLARRLFSAPLSLFFLAVIVLAPACVDLSMQLHWYGVDFLVACLVFLLLAKYMEHPDRRTYLTLLAVLVVGLGFSYTTILFVPAACWMVWRAGSPHDRWFRLALCAGASGAVGLTLWYVFIHAHPNPAMYTSLATLFPPRPLALPGYYARRFMDLSMLIFTPPSFAPRLVPILIALIIVAGAVYLLLSRRELLLTLTLGPIATLLALNAIRLYPLGGERFNFFIFPSLAILFVAGLEAIAKRWWSDRVIYTGVAVWMIFCSVAVARVSFTGKTANVAGALAFLRQNSAPGDAIFVHPALNEQFLFYRRLAPDPAGTFVTGNLGWPCCVRSGTFFQGPVPTEAIVADFQSGLAASRTGRVWYVYDETLAGPRIMKRDQRGQLLPVLRQQGCHVSAPHYFGGTSIEEIVCTIVGRTSVRAELQSR